MFCKNCGQEVTEGKFCSACGAPVEEATPVVPAVETPAPVAPAQTFVQTEPVVNPDPIPTTPMEPVVNPVVAPAAPVDPGKNGGMIALILGIVGIALGTICSCVFACLGGIIPLACSIAGIIVGSKAKQASEAAGFKNSQAQIGMILSIVAIVIIVIFIIINTIMGGVLAASYYG